MFKVLHFIRRKPHLTHEQFRDHFERSHAAMALRFCGHLFTAYQRNYFTTVYTGGDARQAGSGYGPRAGDWDLISEWILPDEAAYDEIRKIITGDVIRQFHELEEKFLDRPAQVMLRCSVADTGTRPAS